MNWKSGPASARAELEPAREELRAAHEAEAGGRQRPAEVHHRVAADVAVDLNADFHVCHYHTVTCVNMSPYIVIRSMQVEYSLDMLFEV